MSAPPVESIARALVDEVAKQLGVSIGDSQQLAELATRATAHVADLVSARAWRDARAAGDAAAERITTLEEAEASARRPR